MAILKLAQLLEAGVHFGHKANRWNPKMFPYIYAERDGIHIFDLVQTVKLLDEACVFVNTAAEKKKNEEQQQQEAQTEKQNSPPRQLEQHSPVAMWTPKQTESHTMASRQITPTYEGHYRHMPPPPRAFPAPRPQTPGSAPAPRSSAPPRAETDPAPACRVSRLPA